jgi:hypothetical protein
MPRGPHPTSLREATFSRKREKGQTTAANKRDAPYQSLIKMWLSEKVG